MIRLTKEERIEMIEGRKAAHLAMGSPAFFTAGTKRFSDGRKLYETLKRFVSSGDFEVILVSNFPLVLAGCDRKEVMSWIADHLSHNDACTLILSGVEGAECPELA